MPCYTPDRTPEEIAQYRAGARRQGDLRTWYQYTSKAQLETWLCEALNGEPPSADCELWHAQHKLYNDKRR